MHDEDAVLAKLPPKFRKVLVIEMYPPRDTMIALVIQKYSERKVPPAFTVRMDHYCWAES